MIIRPFEGNIIVSQCNDKFKKVYTTTLPDTPEGQKEAFRFASAVALGWMNFQDKDWEKHYAPRS